MNPYDHLSTEKYWRDKWEADKVYKTDTHSSKPTFFGLVEFPYPSGAGLHVGHVRSYTGMDVIVRKRRMEGNETLFPIGWDAFGLPAENFALKTGIHPSITTRENINTFREQLKDCGFSFDWDREVDTTDPTYYKWTQWIFLKLYEKGLAYKKQMPVNWCPKDKCVLANEEVVDGKCERCGTPAEKRNKEQWMLAITKYAERLDKDLDDTTFLERIKIQQRNWIGMSEGSEIDFKLTTGDSFTVYTTRADTLFGCTYCVLAPEHSLVKQLLANGQIKNKEEVETYVAEAVQKIDIDRSAEGKEKTGVKLEGVMAINPANQKEVPVFIADYVLATYGTGAIMAVPAHDERDGEFAKRYGIEIKEVIAPYHRDEGEDAAREGFETLYRKVVDVILENDKGQFMLVTDNKGESFESVHFIGGGVEKGDTEIESIYKEVREESGYTDIELVGDKFFPKSGTGFRHTKQKNQETFGFFYHARLKSEDKVHCEVDDGLHEVGWYDKDKIADLITWSHHKAAWLQFLSKDKNIFTGDGMLVDSGTFEGLKSAEARIKITEAVGGRLVKKSKLRDWVFARQRYWGEPIPLVYDKSGKMYPVAMSELPVTLPQVEKYEPTDNGESPLSHVTDWVNVKGKIDDAGYFHTDKDGEEFRRETDTMPQWAGSSWYFMRYIDPRNDTAIGDKEMLMKWLPVTWYNGGMEHTTLHLLYSRFWYKFLFDIGLTPTSEPYIKRTSQGMILGTGGVKMSKSLGNVINPDVIVKKFGADTLRMYEMFIGPFDQAVAWDDKSVIGIRRFVDRVYAIKDKVTDTGATLSITHKTVKKVGIDIEAMAFNTAISSLMICLNEYEKEDILPKNDFKMFIKVLAPFAPFVAEELWKSLGEVSSVHKESWPVYDESKLVNDEVTYVLQVNGKLRGEIVLSKDTAKEDVLKAVKSLDGYEKYVGGEIPKKEIFIPGKLVNIVI
ncbi:MAG: class I tRNA ligase family protein [Candidatus Paceibacterota bacterium]